MLHSKKRTYGAFKKYRRHPWGTDELTREGRVTVRGIEELKDDQNVGTLVGIQEACSKACPLPSLQMSVLEFLMLWQSNPNEIQWDIRRLFVSIMRSCWCFIEWHHHLLGATRNELENHKVQIDVDHVIKIPEKSACLLLLQMMMMKMDPQ